MNKLRSSTLLAGAALLCAATYAAQAPSARPVAAEVGEFLPIGETAKVRQVTVQFSTPMVPFGNPRATDPFIPSCAEKGQGRWIDPTHWAYDFERDLPPGLACSFALRPALRDLGGKALVTRPVYAFNTGGPKVVQSYPPNGSGDVHEEPSFLLELNTPADPASIAANARCISEGKAREPVLLPEAEIKRLVKLYQPYHAPDTAPANFIALRCAGPLPNSTSLELNWAAGIRSAGGVPSGHDQTLQYRVRPVLGYSQNCGKEPCYFESPIYIQFNAPISRAQAQAITMNQADGAPRRQHAIPEGMTYTQDVLFDGPYTPLDIVTIKLPGGIVDEDGRPLGNGAPQTLTLKISDMPPGLEFPTEFGVVERNWHRQVPIMLQNIETRLPVRVQTINTGNDLDLLRALRRYTDYWLYNAYRHQDEQRGWLIGDDVPFETRTLTRRQMEKSRETVYLDLPKTGLYFIEARSERLRAAHGDYHREAFAALVTNLSVQYRHGKENSLIWVTSLDRGLPVAGAAVRITDCDGKREWQGVTDAQGRALVNLPGDAMTAACPGQRNFLC